MEITVEIDEQSGQDLVQESEVAASSFWVQDLRGVAIEQAQGVDL